MKKIEIIVEKRFINDIIELLEKNDISGYSLLEIIKGQGKKTGKTQDYGFISVNKNYLVFSVCDDKEFKTLKSKIVPYVKEMDGFVFVTDVEAL